MKNIDNTFSKEGIDEFLSYFQDEVILALMKEKKLMMLGAFDNELVGVIGIQELSHIHSLFVEGHYQRQGIGTLLLEKAKQLMYGDITVHVSLQAQSFYQKNGFIPIESKQVKHGIELISMIYHSIDEQRFTTYDQVHDFIASQKDRVYALDNFRRFMNDLCDPQKLLKTIHIGGTNGKGSTTNYIRSVLQKEGYQVATFTSPVLETRLEIMRINNQHIQEDEIILYANRYMSLWLEYELSMFEIEVFIAIMFFIKHQVDFAIFEVGLGGELDATNIVSPIVAVNTNIGLDHTEYLGDTYEKIAQTKGGIIKDYIPFITGEKKQSCLHVFQNICQQHHSPFIQVQAIENVHDTAQQVTFDYRGYHIVLNTSARYQNENSALAIEEVIQQAKSYQNKVIFLGDGVVVHKELLLRENNFCFAPIHSNLQRAASVAAFAVKLIEKGKVIKGSELELIYLRKPQAEREREQKLKEAEKC